MSFKDELEETKQEGRDCDTITAKVKETLLAAAKSGESSVFLPLTDEYGYKVHVIERFLENEDIKFKKIYDVKEFKNTNYLDPHMAGYQEALAKNGGSSIYTYMDKKFIFKGIRVFL